MDMSGYALALNSPKNKSALQAIQHHRNSHRGHPVPRRIHPFPKRSVRGNLQREHFHFHLEKFSMPTRRPRKRTSKRKPPPVRTPRSSFDGSSGCPGSTLEKEIEELKAENARKDALIAELKERAEQCEKLALPVAHPQRRGQWPQDRDLCPDRGKRQPTSRPGSNNARPRLPFLTEWIYSPEQGWLYTNAEFFPSSTAKAKETPWSSSQNYNGNP